MNPLNSIPPGGQNKFFGQKVSKPGINVNFASDKDLIYVNDFQTQTFQTANGSLSFGTLKDGSLGMQLADTSGFVLFSMNGSTWSWFDKTTNKNVMQVGLLPDGTYGWAIAKPGKNVVDGF